jgi:hypothetical protein
MKKISRLLIFINSGIIKNELEKVASTDKRKMIWVLLDEKQMPKEIESIASVSDRNVTDFQSILETANLATNP